MNKSSHVVISVVVGLVIASLLILPNALSSKNTETPKAEAKPAAVAANKVAVDTYIVNGSVIDETIQAVGTIAAKQSVDIVSEIARKVTRIFVKEGSYVQQGALLFKLDDADLLARKYKLQQQEKLALLDESRFRELLTTESVTQQEYDQISTNLKVLQAEIGVLEVEIAKTELRAPFSGKIGLTKVDIGAYVTPNTVLTTLQDVSQVEVNFTVPEKYASEVKAGQLVQFTTENATQTFTGKIIATEPKTDVATRSLDILAVSENNEGLLVPGVSTKIDIGLKQIQQGITIPTQALIPTPKGYSLFAIKNGQADLREVKTGKRTKGNVQILEGVSIGDTVITTNILRLGPGVPVSLASAN
ncbi:efflux RND transporter periplasmic adaptor subunit [Rhodocytophaga aerolata]|uniref:Efflux RND transporter periplasmic adaptor subunit n=1 Tax=Rhodocytophaga aerolata TaxID=455078 RepID=A0ABT8RHL5_9BACT|nr:efflux RND transporter periplasmic adaptor subunit [Rhodocytophaga aerolata]MDO1450192.1 efflux RND transporter periplasmic adaptor subunit [Rhodocytophaga aerolata]